MTPSELGRREQAAVLWLSTCDGFKMARCLSPETLRAVYADLVRSGQYPPEENATPPAGTTETTAAGP